MNNIQSDYVKEVFGVTSIMLSQRKPENKLRLSTTAAYYSVKFYELK